VNTTFYRTPADETIDRWVSAVPPEFRFAVKAHRRITHNRRMPNLEDAIATMAALASAYAQRLLARVQTSFRAASSAAL
jgi:uncharacterized protein YecE (DUF72 family)